MPPLGKIQFKTFYHGTPAENEESITEKGLVPRNYAPKGVFLSDSIDVAKGFGNSVYSVDLPENLVHPVGMPNSGFYMVTHGISPHALNKVE